MAPAGRVEPAGRAATPLFRNTMPRRMAAAAQKTLWPHSHLVADYFRIPTVGYASALPGPPARLARLKRGCPGGRGRDPASGHRARCWLPAIACGTMLAVPAKVYAQDLPRVVSDELGTDQMVLLLADADTKSSLSAAWRVTRGRPRWHKRRRLSSKRGCAEREFYLSDPDLVLAGGTLTRRRWRCLRHLGLQVAQNAL